MKRTMKGIAVAVIAAALVLVGGCATAKQDALFAAEQGSLQVINEAQFDAVLFAGKPELGNVLGGVHAQSGRAFNLAKIQDMPPKGAFIIRAVSAETYERKNAAVTGDDVLYTALVVYDLQNPSQTVQVNIPRQIDGSMSHVVYATNNSGMALELRIGSPVGPIAAAFSPSERKRIWLVPDPSRMPYMLFAVFKSVDPVSGEARIVESDTRGLRVTPVQAGMSLMVLEFNSRENRSSPVTLLFE
jgi:hypothetical protein